MEVVKMKLGDIKAFDRPICACIGYFDGIHRGHQKLIEKTIEKAKERNTYSAMISFEPDPWCVIKGIDKIPHITPNQERIDYVETYGIDKFILLEFTKELSSLSPHEFENYILKAMNVDTLVCGFDFHYGHFGKGNVESLKQQTDFNVEEVEEVDYLDIKISSTRIEEAILSGQVDLANELLGHPYSIRGEVVHGNKIGRTLGFPTANLAVDELYVLPKPGVYVGLCDVGDTQYKAIINIGHNPTLNHQEALRLEVHCLNMNEDLYGQILRVSFLCKLRDEKRFDSSKALIKQLKQDEQDAAHYQ